MDRGTGAGARPCSVHRHHHLRRSLYDTDHVLVRCFGVRRRKAQPAARQFLQRMRFQQPLVRVPSGTQGNGVPAPLGQLSLASLRGRLIEYQLRLG